MPQVGLQCVLRIGDDEAEHLGQRRADDGILEVVLGRERDVVVRREPGRRTGFAVIRLVGLAALRPGREAQSGDREHEDQQPEEGQAVTGFHLAHALSSAERP